MKKEHREEEGSLFDRLKAKIDEKHEETVELGVIILGTLRNQGRKENGDITQRYCIV